MTAEDDLKESLSPSAAHVYDWLQWSEDGQLTIHELAANTGRHIQTIREARHELVDAGVVTVEWTTDDPREKQLVLRGE